MYGVCQGQLRLGLSLDSLIETGGTVVLFLCPGRGREREIELCVFVLLFIVAGTTALFIVAGTTFSFF